MVISGFYSQTTHAFWTINSNAKLTYICHLTFPRTVQENVLLKGGIVYPCSTEHFPTDQSPSELFLNTF
jgi:hypothetical protein